MTPTPRFTPRFTLASLALVFAAAGCGQSASALISGPEKAAVGEIVILDATGSRGQIFEWQPDADCRLKPLDAAGSRVAWIPPAQGEHVIRLRVLHVAGGALSQAETEYRCSVGIGPAPGPGPGPGPSSALSAFVRSLAARHATSPAAAVEARQLADVYYNVAQAIQGGRLTSRAMVANETLLQTSRVLGQSEPSWQPFFRELDPEVRRRLGPQPLVAEIAAAWLEIAEGLRGGR